VDASLARLRVERLDVLNLHNRIGDVRAVRSPHGSGALLSVSDVLGERGVGETVRRLQSDGRAGVIGCCAFGGEHDAVEAIIDSGAFSSVLINYSLLNPSAWIYPPPPNAIDYGAIGARAAARGMAIVALRVLEGGVLSNLCRSDGEASEMLQGLGKGKLDIASVAARFALGKLPDVQAAGPSRNGTWHGSKNSAKQPLRCPQRADQEFTNESGFDARYAIFHVVDAMDPPDEERYKDPRVDRFRGAGMS
jgi:hypothetical protein